MNEKEVKADLQAKVSEILSDLNACVENRLAHLISSGSGVLEEHASSRCTYLVPKAVAHAIIEDYLERKALLSDEGKEISNNYYILL